MSPALVTGDYVFASRLQSNPRRGDIVIFPHVTRKNFYLTKRVVGLPREVIEIEHGKLAADGHVIAEPWANGDLHGKHRWELRRDQLVVLSDNRRTPTEDSRAFGPIGRSGIWRVDLRYWPINRFGQP